MVCTNRLPMAKTAFCLLQECKTGAELWEEKLITYSVVCVKTAGDNILKADLIQIEH